MGDRDDIYTAGYSTIILVNENVCQTKCITSERFCILEQGTENNCVHEYKQNVGDREGRLDTVPGKATGRK